MKKETILRILMNPNGCPGVELRDVRLAAADLIEKQDDIFKELIDEIENSRPTAKGILIFLRSKIEEKRSPCGECKTCLPKGVCPHCGYENE